MNQKDAFKIAADSLRDVAPPPPASAPGTETPETDAIDYAIAGGKWKYIALTDLARKLEKQRAALRRQAELDRENNLKALKGKTHDPSPVASNIAQLRSQLALADADKKRVERYEKRMLWLHDCSTGCKDADGMEWGIYRVKWNCAGQPEEVWQTNSDFSDLDREMQRESAALATSLPPATTNQNKQ